MYLHTQSKCLICFLLVTCPSLTSPTNGMISCSLGGNNIPNPKDNCTFTCNTGYELMGTGTRTCQNDGSWSGNEPTCIGMGVRTGGGGGKEAMVPTES